MHIQRMKYILRFVRGSLEASNPLDKKLYHIFKIFKKIYVYILILNLLNVRLEVDLEIKSFKPQLEVPRSNLRHFFFQIPLMKILNSPLDPNLKFVYYYFKRESLFNYFLHSLFFLFIFHIFTLERKKNEIRK